VSEKIKVFGMVNTALQTFQRLAEIFGFPDTVTAYTTPEVFVDDKPYEQKRVRVEAFISWTENTVSASFIFGIHPATLVPFPRVTLERVVLEGRCLGGNWGPVDAGDGDPWVKTFDVAYAGEKMYFVPEGMNQDFYLNILTEYERLGITLRHFFAPVKVPVS